MVPSFCWQDSSISPTSPQPFYTFLWGSDPFTLRIKPMLLSPSYRAIASGPRMLFPPLLPFSLPELCPNTTLLFQSAFLCSVWNSLLPSPLSFPFHLVNSSSFRSLTPHFLCDAFSPSYVRVTYSPVLPPTFPYYSTSYTN